MGTSSGILNAAYTAVKQNEVGGGNASVQASVADRIIAPSGSGNSGWVIGFNQQDFGAGTGADKGTQAQAALVAALTASGQFNAQNAQNIATALTNAGTSSTVNFSGITNINGTPILGTSGNANKDMNTAITTIDSALQTPAAATSIYNSSLSDFTAEFDALNTQVFQATDLDPAVETALANPTDGALLKIVLADFDNQYNITGGQAMDTLLTYGSATFGGNTTVTLNTTNAATVTQSVMTADLDTYWASQQNSTTGLSNAGVTCDRLASDITQAVAYDTSQGITPPSGEITLTSAYGQCEITPDATGTTFSGTWTDGQFLGTTSESGANTLDLSGSGNVADIDGDDITLTNGATASITGADNTVSVGTNDAVTVGGSGNTVSQSGTVVASDGDTVTVMGSQENVDFSYTQVVVDSGSQATVKGNDNTVTASSGDTLTVTGAADTVKATGDIVTLTTGDTGEAITGNTDAITAANSDSYTLTGTLDTAILSGSGEIFSNEYYKLNTPPAYMIPRNTTAIWG